MGGDLTALALFVLSLVAAGGAWFLRTLHSDLRALERCVNRVSQRIAADAVRTETGVDRLTRIEVKLDGIAASLSRKVDREDCREIQSKLYGSAR